MVGSAGPRLTAAHQEGGGAGALLNIDGECFIPSVPLLETFIRGTLVYLSLLPSCAWCQRGQAPLASPTSWSSSLGGCGAERHGQCRSITDGVLSWRRSSLELCPRLAQLPLALVCAPGGSSSC